MKKAKTRPAIVEESLEAIQNVTSNSSIRQGLANTMSALLRGDISADDGHAIAKAAKKRTREISQVVLKEK